MGMKLTTYRKQADIPGLPDTTSVADEQTRLFLDRLKTGYESMRSQLQVLGNLVKVDAAGKVNIDGLADALLSNNNFANKTGLNVKFKRNSTEPEVDPDPDPDNYDTVIVSGNYYDGVYNGTWMRGRDINGKPSFYKTIDDAGETWTAHISLEYMDGDWWGIDGIPLGTSLFGTHNMGRNPDTEEEWNIIISPGKKR